MSSPTGCPIPPDEMPRRIEAAKARFTAGTVNGLWPDVDWIDAP